MKELILYGMFLVLIFLGYSVPLYGDRVEKKWVLPIVFVMFAVVGFFASAYGLVAYFWMFISVLGGYLIGRRRAKIEKEEGNG